VPKQPERIEIIKSIRHSWQDLIKEEDIVAIDLHYLGSGIEVDLVLRQSEISPQLAGDLEAAVLASGYISCLRIFNKLHESKSTKLLS